MPRQTATVVEVIDRLTYINYKHNRRLDATLPTDWYPVYGKQIVDRMEERYQEELAMETIRACPSCYHPYASWIHYPNGESPDEVHCDDCGFDWQARRGVGSPYGDAGEHRLNRQALEEEATAHQGLREEAEAYRGEEWWDNAEKLAAAIDAAYEESQIREIEAENRILSNNPRREDNECS